MKLVILGDSIAAGTYTGENDWCPLSKAKTFGSIIGERLGFSEVLNLAVNGISYKCEGSVNPEYSIINQEKRAPECDMLIISAGTNDFGIDIPLGDKNDNGDVSFIGAVELVFGTIAKNRKNTKVIIVTPYVRKQETNKLGFKLNDYRSVLVEKASKYGFTVVYGERVELTDGDLRDGLHPDDNGHEKIAEYILKNI